MKFIQQKYFGGLSCVPRLSIIQGDL